MLDLYEKNARLKWPQSLVAIYKMKYGNLTQPLTPIQRRLVKNIWQIHLLESIIWVSAILSSEQHGKSLKMIRKRVIFLSFQPRSDLTGISEQRGVYSSNQAIDLRFVPFPRFIVALSTLNVERRMVFPMKPSGALSMTVIKIAHCTTTCTPEIKRLTLFLFGQQFSP